VPWLFLPWLLLQQRLESQRGLLSVLLVTQAIDARPSWPTTFLAYKNREKPLPTAKDIFENTETRKSQKTFV
jgi:hypothetical protein